MSAEGGDAEQIAGRLAQLIRLPTVADADPAVFAEFERTLRGCYPLVHSRLELERVTDRGLLYRWPGRDASLDPVVLMAHWDVVPAEVTDGWRFEPFAAEFADGAMWGRGTLDDKGQLCVLLEAVEAALADGVQPERDVYVSLGGDEESFGSAAQAAVAAFHARGATPWFVLDEGGAVVDAPLPRIPVRAAMIGVAEKGIATIELRAHGEPGHASAPGRHIATTRLARAVRRLQRRPFPARVNASTRAMFRALGAHVRGRARLLCLAIAAVPWLAAPLLARLGGEAAALVRTTVAVTQLAAGSASNVLPQSATATLNVRIAPGESVAHVRERIRRAVADRQIVINVLAADEPSPESPRSGAPFALLERAVDFAFPGVPVVPYVQLSATDSRHFHRFTPAVYRFAPLEMTAAQRASIHGVDEHVRLDSLTRGVAFYRALVQQLSAPTKESHG